MKFLMLLLCACSVATAKPVRPRGVLKKNAPPSSESVESEKLHTFSVPVPQTQIQIEPEHVKQDVKITALVSLSSWVPDQFVRSSFSGQNSALHHTGPDMISLDGVRDLWRAQNGVGVGAKLGASFLTMERSVGEGSQTLGIFMGRVGLESSWLNRTRFEPTLGFNVLPTWISADQSVFEKGVGAFAFGYEGTAGLRVHFSSFVVGAGVQSTWGSIGGSSLKGTGIFGAMGVTL